MIGSLALTVLTALLLSPPATEFRPPAFLDAHLRTHHFHLHFRARYQVAVEDLAPSLEAIRDRILADLGSSNPAQTTIFLGGDSDELQAAAPTGASVPAWATGLAFPKLNLILLRLKGPSAQTERLVQVFAHEWSHIALAHAVDFRRIPRWFSEGFAMYQAGEWSLERSQTLSSGVVSKRIFSLAALTDSFPETISDVELAYAQSVDFVGFLLGEFGPDPFHRLVRLLAEGWPFFVALEEAYDTGIHVLEDRWRQDLKLRFTWIPLITGTATFWFLATLVFVLAYLKKRRSRRMALEQLDDEEPPDPPPPIRLNP
jgi:hypothetical protein